MNRHIDSQCKFHGSEAVDCPIQSCEFPNCKNPVKSAVFCRRCRKLFCTMCAIFPCFFFPLTFCFFHLFSISNRFPGLAEQAPPPRRPLLPRCSCFISFTVSFLFRKLTTVHHLTEFYTVLLGSSAPPEAEVYFE